MKYISLFYKISIALCVIVMLYAVFQIPFFTKTEWSDYLQTIAVFLALGVSIFALRYAGKEYEVHKKAEKTALLCQYLQRYTESPIIKKVVDYMLDTALLDEKGHIIGFDKNKQTENTPSIREKEMFMHFFEEIQLHIEDGMIDKDTITKQIGYYAYLFHKIEGFRQDITDYENEKYWEYYLKFVRSIKEDFFNE